MSFSEIYLQPFLESFNHQFDEEELDFKINLGDKNYIRNPKSYFLKNNTKVDSIRFIYTQGGNGYVELAEAYMIEDYGANKPYRLVEFIYEIKIDKRYNLHIHYHPDSTCEKHSFVHIHATKEGQTEVRVYLIPWRNFNPNNILDKNEKFENCIWDSSYNWGNFFVRMFESHSADSKNVDIDDCLQSIFSKLNHTSAVSI